MRKAGVGTNVPHVQIKILEQEIKQKSFRSKFEIKNWNVIKVNWFSNEIEFEINLKFSLTYLKISFKFIFKFKLNMKVKFTLEMRIVYKTSLALMGHNRLLMRDSKVRPILKNIFSEWCQ